MVVVIESIFFYISFENRKKIRKLDNSFMTYSVIKSYDSHTNISDFYFYQTIFFLLVIQNCCY